MPQNSKYSHPQLGLCHVRGGIYSGQPLSSLKRGACLLPKPVLLGTKTCLADTNSFKCNYTPHGKRYNTSDSEVKRQIQRGLLEGCKAERMH